MNIFQDEYLKNVCSKYVEHDLTNEKMPDLSDEANDITLHSKRLSKIPSVILAIVVCAVIATALIVYTKVWNHSSKTATSTNPVSEDLTEYQMVGTVYEKSSYSVQIKLIGNIYNNTPTESEIFLKIPWKKICHVDDYSSLSEDFTDTLYVGQPVTVTCVGFYEQPSYDYDDGYKIIFDMKNNNQVHISHAYESICHTSLFTEYPFQINGRISEKQLDNNPMNTLIKLDDYPSCISLLLTNGYNCEIDRNDTNAVIYISIDKNMQISTASELQLVKTVNPFLIDEIYDISGSYSTTSNKAMDEISAFLASVKLYEHSEVATNFAYKVILNEEIIFYITDTGHIAYNNKCYTLSGLSSHKEESALRIITILQKYYETESKSHEITLDEYPDVTFSWDDDKVEAITDKDSTTLMEGMPILNVYFSDLNDDGYSEICATVAFGSGIVDVYVTVYDYHNQKHYEIRDRGNYDFCLKESSPQVIVEKHNYSENDILETGTLKIVDDKLEY